MGIPISDSYRPKNLKKICLKLKPERNERPKVNFFTQDKFHMFPFINPSTNPLTTYLFNKLKSFKLSKELQQLTKKNLLKKPNPLLFKTLSSFLASSTPSSNLLSLIPFKSPK